MAKTPKLTKAEIRWDKRAQTWYYRERDGALWRRGGTSADPTDEENKPLTKAEFIRIIIGTLKERVAGGVHGFSLRICNKNNVYFDERTIPRGLDPRRSKG